VVMDNCIRCHQDLLRDEKVQQYTGTYNHERSERPCWDCHRETPHGRVNSISSVPYARVPVPGSTVPSWLRKKSKNLK
jgi:cytochrome c nitrite reductase small subunit